MTFIPDRALALKSGGNDRCDATHQTYISIQGAGQKSLGIEGPGYRVDGPMLALGASEQHAVAFSIYPESGQGTDLRAGPTDRSPAIAAVDGSRQSERGLRIASELGVRRLTPSECERLQGLPDGWTLPGSDSKRYAGLGDAVTANVAEWIGRRILTKEGVTTK
jgi:DNA (cytosine-5)-methyltransferase 1